MALKYVASNKTYDFGKSEYTTTSNKYKRLNYIANGKTYQIGLATDSTATQYSPLKMKINDSTYYIGRSSSRSSSSSYRSTYSSRITRINTYSYSHIAASIKTRYAYYVWYFDKTIYNDPWENFMSTDTELHDFTETYDEPQQSSSYWISSTGYDVGYKISSMTCSGKTEFGNCTRLTETTTYTRSESKTSNEYSTTTVSSSTSNATTIVSNNFV